VSELSLSLSPAIGSVHVAAFNIERNSYKDIVESRDRIMSLAKVIGTNGERCEDFKNVPTYCSPWSFRGVSAI
jgi:hypothetical protein